MLGGVTSDVMAAVVDAMKQAGIAPGDPVMIAGHSLGGITAMALASNDDFASQFNVQSVVTAGSPVGGYRPDASVSIVSFENTTDLVPAFDGTRNPDQANWITVRHDLRESADATDRAAASSLVRSHEVATYERTAAMFDDSASSSARAWRDDNALFLADGETESIRTVYTVVRS